MNIIWLIENNSAWANILKQFLRRYPDLHDFQVTELYNKDDVEEALQDVDDDFSSIKAILLDIYLKDTGKRGKDLGPPDGFALLPRLRERLPWVPVLAFTSHCDDSSRLCEISCQAFDGILPKSYFNGASFDAATFNRILAIAEQHRVASARADVWTGLDALDGQPKRAFVYDRMSESVATEIGKERLEQVLSRAFPEQREFTLCALKPGFSGAHVFSLATTGKRPAVSAYWVAKVSSAIPKLLTEMRAYWAMQVGGLHHDLYPPLLHRGVLVAGGLGLIVYQLEKNAKSLLDSFQNEEEAVVCARIRALGAALVSLHGDREKKQAVPRRVWFPIELLEKQKEALDRILSTTPAGWDPRTAHAEEIRDLHQLIEAASGREKANHWMLDQDLGLEFAQLHGDLHSENILAVGTDRVVLIDFAHYGPGPLVNDYAKLETDLIVRGYPSVEAGRVPAEIPALGTIDESAAIAGGLANAEEQGFSKLNNVCLRIREQIPAAAEDTGVPLRMALLHFSLQYLSSPDISPDQQRIAILRCVGIVRELRAMLRR